MTKTINSPVSITAIGFGRNLCAYPKRMEWQGKTFCFIDKGIRATIRRGESIMSTVTLSDGTQNFCLRAEGERWTLLSVC
ncbi:hypothetical protein EOL96_02590 [Candidatus Saccharibacteria bacterium]|nr:hypothetical protein [Candidatus Saccharibacteria bacterium]